MASTQICSKVSMDIAGVGETELALLRVESALCVPLSIDVLYTIYMTMIDDDEDPEATTFYSNLGFYRHTK